MNPGPATSLMENLAPTSSLQGTIEEAGWSWTRWAAVVAVIFLGQAAVLWGLMSEPRAPAVRKRSEFHVLLDLQNHAWNQARESPFWSNPRSFAGDDRRGFSGFAVEQLGRPQFIAEEATPSMQWLSATNGNAGASPLERVRLPNREPEQQILNRLGMPPVAAGHLGTRRVIEVGDDVAKLRLLSVTPRFESLSSYSFPSPIIQFAVGPDGHVFSAMIVRSSGDPDKDGEALRETRRLVFAPIAATNSPGTDAENWALTWGQMYVEWGLPSNATSPTPRSQDAR